MRTENISPTTFNAKLDIKSVQAKHPRFENIARIFSDITKDYPNAVLSINYRNASNNACFYAYKKQNLYEIVDASVDSKGWDKLLTYSDNFIATKLAKVFKLGYNYNTDINTIFDNSTKLVKRYAKDKDLEETRKQILAPVRNLLKTSVEEQIAKDKVLSTWDVQI